MLRIIANKLFGARSPSMTQSALKILCRQCSEFACANIMSSTSVGLRFSAANCAARYSISSRDSARPNSALARSSAARPPASTSTVRTGRGACSRTAAPRVGASVEQRLRHSIVQQRRDTPPLGVREDRAHRKLERPGRARSAAPAASRSSRCRWPSKPMAKSCRAAARRRAADARSFAAPLRRRSRAAPSERRARAPSSGRVRCTKCSKCTATSVTAGASERSSARSFSRRNAVAAGGPANCSIVMGSSHVR